MGMKEFERGSRSRQAREGGWLGRRRNYRCRRCGNKFQVDTIRPLAEEDRICHICKVETGQAVNPYHSSPEEVSEAWEFRRAERAEAEQVTHNLLSRNP